MAIPNDPSTFWSMMEALGSIGAVLLALVLSMSNVISSWWNSPNLIIEKSDDFSEDFDPRYPAQDHRLRIRNNGRTTAKNVRIKIKKIEYCDPKDKPEHLEYVSSSLLESEGLHWGDYENFTVLWADDVEGCIGIKGKSQGILRADCYITLMITGENFRGFESKWKFIDNQNCYDTSLNKI